ncbi:MAG: O-antigen ligase family protein [Thermoleophilia bacterium]
MAVFGACLVILFTAFEVRQPVFSLGPISFTTTELAAGFFFLVSIAWALTARALFFSRRVLDVAVALFLVSNFLSAAVAVDSAGAFKFSLRMTYATLVYLGISRLPRRSGTYRLVLGTVTATLVTVTVIGLLENFVSFVYWPHWLSPWQEGVFTFGTFYNVRISSTLPFPTTLSIYLEMAAPLALVFAVLVSDSGHVSRLRRQVNWAVIAGLAGIAATQVYTFTRSALVATPVSMAAGFVLSLYYGYGRRLAWFFALGGALLVFFLVYSLIFSNKMATRLGVAEQVQHYGAEYQVLDFPTSVRTGEQYSTLIRVRNTSQVDWEPMGADAVQAASRWMEYPDKKNHRVQGLVTDIPGKVASGEQVDLNVGFMTPDEPGRYVFIVELAKKGVGWFSADNVPPVIIPLQVDETGSTGFSIAETSESFVWAAPAMDTAPRSQLWQAAFKAWRAHPVLGLGPDQFRLRYFEYMPELPRDERVRTHNIFLEALTNTGIVGLAVMLLLLASTFWYQVRMVSDRSLGRPVRLVALALFVSLLAYVIHGLLDCFLWQTGMAFMFFAQLGMTAWLYDFKSRGAVPGV